MNDIAESKNNKPPLGLMPEWRHKELRLAAINDAIGRYLEENKPIPIPWIAELCCLQTWLQNRKEDDKSACSVVEEKSSQTVLSMEGKDWEILEKCPIEGSIYKVRRPSDNSIWRVRDQTADGEIESFEIVGECIKTNLVGNKYLWFHTLLPPEPVKEILFKDYLDNDIYEGDKYCVVQKGSFQILDNCIHKLNNPGNWIAFKEESAAREYVTLNRPMFSIKDVESVYSKGRSFVGTDFLIDGLKELAKQKTNI